MVNRRKGKRNKCENEKKVGKIKFGANGTITTSTSCQCLVNHADSSVSPEYPISKHHIELVFQYPSTKKHELRHVTIRTCAYVAHRYLVSSYYTGTL